MALVEEKQVQLPKSLNFQQEKLITTTTRPRARSARNLIEGSEFLISRLLCCMCLRVFDEIRSRGLVDGLRNSASNFAHLTNLLECHFFAIRALNAWAFLWALGCDQHWDVRAFFGLGCSSLLREFTLALGEGHRVFIQLQVPDTINNVFFYFANININFFFQRKRKEGKIKGWKDGCCEERRT